MRIGNKDPNIENYIKYQNLLERVQKRTTKHIATLHTVS